MEKKREHTGPVLHTDDTELTGLYIPFFDMVITKTDKAQLDEIDERNNQWHEEGHSISEPTSDYCEESKWAAHLKDEKNADHYMIRRALKAKFEGVDYLPPDFYFDAHEFINLNHFRRNLYDDVVEEFELILTELSY